MSFRGSHTTKKQRRTARFRLSVRLGSQSTTDEPRQAVLWVWHKPAGGEMKNVKGGETQVLLTPPTGHSLQQQRTYIGQSRGHAGPSHTSNILIWANIRPFIIFFLYSPPLGSLQGLNKCC